MAARFEQKLEQMRKLVTPFSGDETRGTGNRVCKGPEARGRRACWENDEVSAADRGVVREVKERGKRGHGDGGWGQGQGQGQSKDLAFTPSEMETSRGERAGDQCV